MGVDGERDQGSSVRGVDAHPEKLMEKAERSHGHRRLYVDFWKNRNGQNLKKLRMSFGCRKEIGCVPGCCGDADARDGTSEDESLDVLYGTLVWEG